MSTRSTNESSIVLAVTKVEKHFHKGQPKPMLVKGLLGLNTTLWTDIPNLSTDSFDHRRKHIPAVVPGVASTMLVSCRVMAFMSVLFPAFMTPNTPILMRGTSLPLAGPTGNPPPSAAAAACDKLCCRCCCRGTWSCCCCCGAVWASAQPLLQTAELAALLLMLLQFVLTCQPAAGWLLLLLKPLCAAVCRPADDGPGADKSQGYMC